MRLRYRQHKREKRTELILSLSGRKVILFSERDDAEVH